MTSQFDVTMGKERRQPRYQGSLRATFDLRLYLYTFDCEKNKIKEIRKKERTLSHV